MSTTTRTAQIPETYYSALCYHRPPASDNLGTGCAIFIIATNRNKTDSVIRELVNTGTNFPYTVGISDNKLTVSNLNIYAAMYYIAN